MAATDRGQPHLPATPIQDLIRRQIRDGLITSAGLSERLGFSWARYGQIMRAPEISFWVADSIATLLGRHLAELYPDHYPLEAIAS